MKKIGILGGTFDPIHIGHINIAYEALYKLKLDKVIFMVNGNPPHKKDNSITKGIIRYSLIEKAIKEEKLFEVSDYELKSKEKNYTYKTLEDFSKNNKNYEIYFITGADCLVDLPNWKNVESILNSCNFVVFKRIGYDEEKILKVKKEIEKKYNKPIIYIDIPIFEISATYIREKISKKENISYMIPKGVYEEIEKNHLYRG